VTRATPFGREAIASVKGVDGVFIGPADLAASLGQMGNPGHPEVVTEIERAVHRVRACGKAVGILTPNLEFARRCRQLSPPSA
jgi:4-hydroxy-2-oxoheptanedioate aldolase